MFRNKLMFLMALPPLLAALPAQAYIGPGMGAGTLAVVLGILASIVLAFFAVLWYPVKRLIRRFRGPKPADRTDPPESS